MLTGPPPRLRDDERVTVRYECPIGPRPWTLDNPGPDPSEGCGQTIEEIAFSAVRAHLLRSEAAIRGHLETHSLLEWAQEIQRLKTERWRSDKDALAVAAILLRRLGGSAEITDAELAAERGILQREPAIHGFRLSVTA